MSLKSIFAHIVRRLNGYYMLRDQIAELARNMPTAPARDAKPDETAYHLGSFDKKTVGNRRYISLLEFRPNQKVTVMPSSSYMEKTNGTLEAENCILNVDENGFIVTDKQCRRDDIKILLLSGSSIENLYIPDSERISSQLEAQFTSAGKSAKIYNGGISFAHTLHLVNSLLNKGIPLRPQYLVYYSVPALNVFANEVEGSFWNPLSEMTPIKTAGQPVITGVVTEFKNRNGFKDERALLATLCDICANFGIKLFLATWPVYDVYDEFMKIFQPDKNLFEQEKAQTIILNDVVREIAITKKVGIIDLQKIFEPLNHQDFFYDWNHPNKKGCAMIARETFQALTAQTSTTQRKIA